MIGAPARAVVVADDDLFFSSRIAAGLKALGYRPLVVSTPEALRARLREGPDAAIFNLAVRGFDAGAVHVVAAAGVVRLSPVAHGVSQSMR